MYESIYKYIQIEHHKYQAYARKIFHSVCLETNLETRHCEI